MPDKEAIERGLSFEKRVADVLDGETQPGSGNKWFAPSDVRAHGLLISCKSEENISLAGVVRHLNEAIDLSQGSGCIPALAFQFKPTAQSDELVLIRLTDLSRAFSSGIEIPDHSDSKGISKRKTADVPLLLR